jgi:hypothetical protein
MAKISYVCLYSLPAIVKQLRFALGGKKISNFQKQN